MTPAIVEHDVTVHLGDVREQLALLAAGSVQCCVTSPPYYGLRDYGVDGQIGLEPSPAEYVAEMVAVFAGVRRVLADDGVLWLNLGDSYANPSRGGTQGSSGQRASRTFTAAASGGCTALPPKNLLGIPWRVALALQNDGWILRNTVIWSKPNAMPESVTDRLSTKYEHVFLFAMSHRYTFDLDAIREERSRGERFDAVQTGPRKGHEAAGPGDRMRSGSNPQSVWNTGIYKSEGRNPGDVWTIATSPFPGAHFATMPPELARRCILAGCPEGATVLDPFTGSGTTAMVARSLGRRFVGIELNPDYIPIIRGRIGQQPFDFGASA